MVFQVPKPPNEDKRLAALARYRILDTPAEAAFDDFAALASFICGTPIALVNLVADTRQWTLAKVGLESENTPREHAFCSYTILGTGPMVVEDATTDYRFAGNPLVTDEPNIRFYAGAPLIDAEGFALGSLCVIDRSPRTMTSRQLEALDTLSRRLTAQLELHRTTQELAAALEEIKTLRGLIPICSHCKGVRDDAGFWQSIETYFAMHIDVDFSHGVCPDCLEKYHPEVAARLRARQAAAGK